MKSGRDKKIAEEIRREASQILHYEMKDPRVMGATVTGVKMSPDLRLARIYYAMPGSEERKESAKAGLKKSSGFVRHLLAERMQMKFMPQIEFFYDESFELEAKLNDLFKDLPPSDKEEIESND
jgi:ribosome-binding factor A